MSSVSLSIDLNPLLKDAAGQIPDGRLQGSTSCCACQPSSRIYEPHEPGDAISGAWPFLIERMSLTSSTIRCSSNSGHENAWKPCDAKYFSAGKHRIWFLTWPFSTCPKSSCKFHSRISTDIGCWRGKHRACRSIKIIMC